MPAGHGMFCALSPGLPMSAALEHVYRYSGESHLTEASGRPALQLVTSGGQAPHPFFFEGELTRPRPTALALRALSRLVGTRFFVPPAMLGRILAAADPVVTSGRGMLRFEGFSGCASAYGRVDLTADAYRGDTAAFGTTNVDFNAGMRAALAGVRDAEPLGLSVGKAGLVLHRTEGAVVERKVPLPPRWLKGFVEVQAYLSRLTPFAELSATEALRFLRSLPRSSTRKHAVFLLPQRGSLRLSMTPATGALRTSGLERLRVLEELLPLARGLRVYGDAEGQCSAWELELGGLRFTLALSGEVWRGFSGEGQALSALARHEALAHVVARTRAQLHWDPSLAPAGLATRVDASEEDVADALRILGARGLVGFDQRLAAYFHRELPFDLEKLEALSPRLQDARALLDAGAVTPVPGEPLTYLVRSGDVSHRALLTPDGEPLRCSCPWYGKHTLTRGPCKHTLAAQLHWESSDDA